MTAGLRRWWRAFVGLDLAYSQGYAAGVHAVESKLLPGRASAFAHGFLEGRESVRTYPLDAPLDASEDEEDQPCHSH